LPFRAASANNREKRGLVRQFHTFGVKATQR
jgi:hypothetical protein